MGEELTEAVGGADSSGLSRRNALKAGVAVGVGVAAWSGVSITSLGGTPAYAQGCTGVIVVDLSAGCRNTDQGAASNCTTGTYGYHPLKSTGLPTGFGIGTAANPNIEDHTCCDLNSQVGFTFPNTLQCLVTFEGFANTSDCTAGGPIEESATVGSGAGNGGSGSATLLITLGCIAGVAESTHYTITAFCNTIGAPTNCLG